MDNYNIYDEQMNEIYETTKEINTRLKNKKPDLEARYWENKIKSLVPGAKKVTVYIEYED